MVVGVGIGDENEMVGIFYFMWYYWIKFGKFELLCIGNLFIIGDLGFLKFGVFFGDNGCFLIIMCIFEIEYELCKVIVDLDIFYVMILMLLGFYFWMNEE